MSNLDFMCLELANLRSLSAKMGDTRNPVVFMQMKNSDSGIYLDLERSNTTAEDMRYLMLAFIETYELSLNDVERMHEHIKSRIREVSHQLLETAVEHIIPEEGHR